MLGTLEQKQKSRWKDHIKPLVHAYNCTKNEVTGFSPYELMFGRTPRLPVDLAFNLPVRGNQHKNYSKYIQTLKSRSEESFRIASKNAIKSADRKTKPASMVDGRNVRLRGKHKLSDKWEQGVYVMVHRAGDLPVYIIKPESCDGPMRTLHRDLLLPCSFLQETDADSPLTEHSPVRKPRTRQQSENPDPSTEPPAEDQDNESLVAFSINPSTMHFTVEKNHASVPNLSVENDGQSLLLPEPPVEVQEEPAPSPSCTPPPAVESSSEQSKSYVENVPETQPEKNDLLDPPTDLLEPDVLTTDPPDESNPVEQPNCDSDVALRRSQRQRAPPNRLLYSTRGNPLISVVQTMLHSLSDALLVSRY